MLSKALLGSKIAAGGGASEAVIIGINASPYIVAYSWSNTTGFGSKYSNPSTLPPFAVNYLAINKENSKIIFIANNTVRFYNWSNSSGFGSYSSPGNILGPVSDLTIAPNSSAIAVADGASPFIHGYQWSNSTGLGTKSSNPSTLPTGAGNGCAFSGDSSYVAVAHNVSPFISVYPWSASGFGTKVANPSTLPTGGPSTLGMTACVFTSTNDALLMSNYGSPYIQAYAWSGGFGTKYSNPSTLPTGSSYAITMNNANSAVAVTMDSSPYIHVYAWSSGSGFGTKYSNPSTTAVFQGGKIQFSNDDAAIITSGTYNGGGTNPGVQAYAWSNSTGFGSAYSAPSSFPTGFNNSTVDFTN
jgi:hypothetical protein